jgi:nucleoside-diphosphate-sugar epimerase
VTNLLVLGATGFVGGSVVRLALEDPRVATVIAPTRRTIAHHPRLQNPVVDFDLLDPNAPWWRVHAVISALGTTTRATPSAAEYERIEVGYPVAVATVEGMRAILARSPKRDLSRGRAGRTEPDRLHLERERRIGFPRLCGCW